MVDVIPFPLDRYVGKARYVAAMINRRRTIREREIYFRSICRSLANQLRRAGLEESEVSRQIDAFTKTVKRSIAEGWHFPPASTELGPSDGSGRRGAAFEDNGNNHPPGAA